jgi:hypothetical protein
MSDLTQLNYEDFAALVGQSLVANFTDIGPIELEVVSAGPHLAGAPATNADGQRTPFTVVFHGPREPVLPQHMYRLDHEATGPLDIFIVPLGRDADKTTYEAVFA